MTTAEELMDGRPELDRFLRTDPRDVGCAQAMEMLHIYAELAAAGGPVEQQYPGIAAHLRACGPVAPVPPPALDGDAPGGARGDTCSSPRAPRRPRSDLCTSGRKIR